MPISQIAPAAGLAAFMGARSRRGSDINKMAARLRDRRMAKDSPLADARADRSPVSAMGGAGRSSGSPLMRAGLAAATLPVASTTAVAKGFKKLFG